MQLLANIWQTLYFFVFLCMNSLLLLISADVHPNPGPIAPQSGSNVSLETSTSSSGSDIRGMSALTDHLNNVYLNHVNIQ